MQQQKNISTRPRLPPPHPSHFSATQCGSNAHSSFRLNVFVWRLIDPTVFSFFFKPKPPREETTHAREIGSVQGATFLFLSGRIRLFEEGAPLLLQEFSSQ